MLRFRMLLGVALAALVAVVALPVSSFAFIEYFVAEGQGTTNLNSSSCETAGLICNDGDVCQCIETTGPGALLGTLGGLNGGSFDLLLSVDTSTALNDGTGRSCFPSSGTAVLTASDGSVLALETTGLACNGPSFDLGLYSGAYGVQSASGQFYRVSGAGTLSWSDTFSNNSGLIQVTGNISTNTPPSTAAKSSSSHFFSFVWPPKK
jgi:hypothetical protein